MDNPFVYGEVVPASAFVDREQELDRLTRDLLAGQKVFLISPRRYGKSSLVRQALRGAARQRALTIDVTVSSYSSYPAFLEGYARALLTADARPDRIRGWIKELLGGFRPELRLEAGSQIALSFPSARTRQVWSLPRCATTRASCGRFESGRSITATRPSVKLAA